VTADGSFRPRVACCHGMSCDLRCRGISDQPDGQEAGTIRVPLADAKAPAGAQVGPSENGEDVRVARRGKEAAQRGTPRRPLKRSIWPRRGRRRHRRHTIPNRRATSFGGCATRLGIDAISRGPDASLTFSRYCQASVINSHCVQFRNSANSLARRSNVSSSVLSFATSETPLRPAPDSNLKAISPSPRKTHWESRWLPTHRGNRSHSASSAFCPSRSLILLSNSAPSRRHLRIRSLSPPFGGCPGFSPSPLTHPTPPPTSRVPE